MDGRTYRIHSTEEYRIYSKGFFHGTSNSPYYPTEEFAYYTVWRDFVVPNGTWVAELPLFGRNRLIGVDHSLVRSKSIDERYGVHRWLYMSDRPFGFATYIGDDWEEGYSMPLSGPMSLIYARQIHKGELGQGVPIPKLKFAREEAVKPATVGNFTRNRHQRRNHIRWARLSDVVSATGRPVYGLLSYTWAFGDWHPHYELGQRIDVRYGADHVEVSSATMKRTSLTIDELSRQIMDGRLDQIWIRSGFANTILRLIALGYQPQAITIA